MSLNDCNDNDDDDDDNDDRPKTPLEEDCCGSGCTPCIFDVHKKLLNEWKNRKTQDVKITISNNLLSPLLYKIFTITDVSETSKDSILVHLEHQASKIQKNINLHLTPGQHVMLHSWCMTRPYTPISWTSKGSLVFLIKVYKQGKFTARLKEAALGSAIDVRGPYGDFTYKSNSFQRIIMFGIGSGIAALYPVARMIVDDEMESTRVHLVAGFRSMPHVPLKKELRNLVDYWNFECTLHLSQLNDEASLHGFNIKPGRLSEPLVANYLQYNDLKTTLILICGTPEFNQFIKKWIQKMNYTHIHIFE